MSQLPKVTNILYYEIFVKRFIVFFTVCIVRSYNFLSFTLPNELKLYSIHLKNISYSEAMIFGVFLHIKIEFHTPMTVGVEWLCGTSHMTMTIYTSQNVDQLFHSSKY